MKDENRCIVTKLEIFDNELVAIHALEIIDNIITGIYFHGYLKKDIYQYNDMYYLSKFQFGENYLQNFINFVGNSKLITYNEEFEKIKKYIFQIMSSMKVLKFKEIYLIRQEKIKLILIKNLGMED